jgi:hypothetical protein
MNLIFAVLGCWFHVGLMEDFNINISINQLESMILQKKVYFTLIAVVQTRKKTIGRVSILSCCF